MPAQQNYSVRLLSLVFLLFIAVLLWWIIWSLLDRYLFPNSIWLKYIVALIAALILSIILIYGLKFDPRADILT